VNRRHQPTEENNMSYRTALSQAEWESLEFGVICVFFGVAASDGKVDGKEIEAFAQGINATLAHKSLLAREVFESVNNNLSDLLARYKADQRNQLKMLMDVADILEKSAPADQRDSFKRDLMSIAVHVANATGGFLGLGDKIGKDEKSALMTMAVALRVDFSDRG
jgi:uncharacterized tellurite resistance protein B-like protein